MIALEDVRKANNLTLQELGKAVQSMWIQPNEDYEVSVRDSKRIADWTEGYREF